MSPRDRDRRRSESSREARRARRATEQAADTARMIASIEAQVGPVEARIDWDHVDHLRSLVGLPPQGAPDARESIATPSPFNHPGGANVFGGPTAVALPAHTGFGKPRIFGRKRRRLQ